MKKTLLTLFGCVILASCTNEVEQMDANMDAQNDIQYVVEEESSPNVTLADIQAYMDKGSDIASRNGGDGEIEVITYQNDTVMYLLKYGNGWEMMPGDKRFPLRVAYNDKGTLDYAKMNDAQHMWFESVAEKIHVMKKHGKGIENEYCKVWNALTKKNKHKNHAKSRTVIDGQGGWLYHNTRIESYVSGQKNHLITTLWHQESPYNKYCPYDSVYTQTKCPVGCNAVATGQVLNYLHGFIGTPQYSVTNQTYNATKREYTFTGWSTSEWSSITLGETDNIARLLGHIGVLADMKYAHNGSSCSLKNDIPNALNEYGIKSSYEYGWNSTTILNDLNKNLPILAAMHGAQGNSTVGHTIVIDGYKKVVTQYTDVYIYVEDMDSYPGDIYDHDEEMNPVPEEGPTQETSYFTTDTYYLVNWGYGSLDNTYYLSIQPLVDGSITYNIDNYIRYNLQKK